MINTSKSCSLPSHQTPFEVFFGRKPHWIGNLPLEDSDSNKDNINGDDDDSDDYPETDEEALEITEIEAQVVANNLKVHKRIAKRGGSTTIFNTGDLVTLKIPNKLRLVGELLHLLA